MFNKAAAKFQARMWDLQSRIEEDGARGIETVEVLIGVFGIIVIGTLMFGKFKTGVDDTSGDMVTKIDTFGTSI